MLNGFLYGTTLSIPSVSELFDKTEWINNKSTIAELNHMLYDFVPVIHPSVLQGKKFTKLTDW